METLKKFKGSDHYSHRDFYTRERRWGWCGCMGDDGTKGGLSNTVDHNPVVSPCFPSENRKSSDVKSYQVYWMHWTRIDSDGKAHFSIRERLTKISLMMDEEVESRSDGVHRIHWTRIDSDGKVHFLFVRDLEKFRSCWMRGWKVVLMESIGSIGNE